MSEAVDAADVSEASPDELQPHPKNAEIYGDTEDVDDLGETFKQSVAEKGVLEPLVITDGKQIISGHRRWRAAKAADLDSVPVRYSEFDSELAEREAVIEFNRQREKTPGQIVNEFEEMLAIEKERAKERKAHGETAPGRSKDENAMGEFSRSEGPDRARDKAAEKVNADVSGRTLEKGKKVKDKATDEDEPDQVQQAAAEAWDGLQSGAESFNSAYEEVKEAEKEHEPDKQTSGKGSSDGAEQENGSGSDISQFTSQETDEWSSPRELVEPLADAVGGFDLDPCSGAETSPFAAETYTEADDGLAQPWRGTVWVNPPYSEMTDWTAKAVKEAGRDATETVFFLAKGDSSTEWWHDALEAATYVVAIDRRLSFGDSGTSAPFASHIFVFGTPDGDAIQELAQHGAILMQRRPKLMTAESTPPRRRHVAGAGGGPE